MRINVKKRRIARNFLLRGFVNYHSRHAMHFDEEHKHQGVCNIHALLDASVTNRPGDGRKHPCFIETVRFLRADGAANPHVKCKN